MTLSTRPPSTTPSGRCFGAELLGSALAVAAVVTALASSVAHASADDVPKNDARDTAPSTPATSTPAHPTPSTTTTPIDPVAGAAALPHRVRPPQARAMPALPIPPGAIGKKVHGVHFNLPEMSREEEVELLAYLEDFNGKPLTPDVLDLVTKRLAAVRKFKQVQCRVRAEDAEGETALLTCDIVRARVLHKVRVTGLPAAILESDVMKRVFLKPGEPLDEDDNTGKTRLVRQTQRIEEFLDREGFIGAAVSHPVTRSEVAGEWNVEFQVHGGSFVRVRHVILKAVGPLSQRELDDAFGSMCFTSEGLLDGLFMGNLTSCFNRRRLQATTEHFLDVLHGAGWPEARIRVQPQLVDPARADDTACARTPKEIEDDKNRGLKPAPRCVDLLVEVQQGTKVIARFHTAPDERNIAKVPSLFLPVYETIFEPVSRWGQLLARAPPSSAEDTRLVEPKLQSALSFEEAGAVDDTEVEVSKESVEKYLGERGRVNPKVDVDSHEWAGARVVDFNIGYAPTATVRSVRFVGNAKLETRTLEKEADLGTQTRVAVSLDSLLGRSGTISQEALDDDEQKLRTVYAQHGFPEANVSAVAQLGAGNNLDVTFVIDEGQEFVVAGIELAGGSPTVTADVLKAIKHCVGGVATKERRDPVVPEDCKGSPLRPDELEADAQRVAQVYASHGFPNVEASIDEAFDKGGTNLRITVLPPNASEAEREHPTLNNVKQVVLGEVFLEGNHTTQRDVLLREAGLGDKVGQPLDPLALGKGITRLRRSGLFNSVELQYLGLDGSFGDNRTAIRLTVDERPAFTVDSSVGFSTEQYFSLKTEVRNKNIFGTMLDADGLVDFGLFIGRFSEAKTQLRWPRIFGSDISASLVAPDVTYLDTPAGVILPTPQTLAGQRVVAPFIVPDKRRRWFSVGALLALDWHVQNIWAPIDDKLTLGASLGVRGDWLNPAADPIENFSLPDFATIDGITTVVTPENASGNITLRPNISYRNVDNPFDPHEGVILEVFTSASISPFIQKPVPYPTYGVFGASVSGYTTLWDRLTFAVGAKTRLGFAPSGEKLQCPVRGGGTASCEWALMQTDLLLLGGERNVRGVNENQIGVFGPVYDASLHAVPNTGAQLAQVRQGLYGGVFNLEARYTLIQRFIIGSLAPAVFFDAGYSADDFNLNAPPTTIGFDTRYAYSVGTGLRLVTPVGPAALDFAYSPDRKTSSFYLSFGYIF
jgi:outer membrane protein assembly factor BamA